MKTLTVLAAVALIAGCSNSTSSNTATTSGTAGTATPQLSKQQAPPARVIVDVTIANGTVMPTNQQLQAKVNQPIIVLVNSDAADELHVHSNPEYEFEVKAAKGQSFQFTVAVPGKVDVELHHLDKTIATITVQ
jgi:hypothetical protein